MSGFISHLPAARGPLIGFAAIGTTWGSFAASVPDLKRTLDLSEGDLGLALLFTSVGALLAMALAPRILGALDGRLHSLLAACTLAGVAYLGVSFATSWLSLGLAMFVLGTASGLLDVDVNARISTIEARHDTHLMSLAHGTFSLAYAIAAFTTGLAREAGAVPSQIYWVAGFVLIGMAMLSWDTQPHAVTADPDSPPEDSALPSGLTLIGLLILIAFFAENATEVWSALHIEQTLGGRAAEGALGPTMLGLTMALGRFSGNALANRFGTRLLMRVASICAVFGGLLATLAPTPMLAYVGFGALGLGISALAPLSFALAGRRLSNANRSRGIARISLIGYLGFFVGPPVLGLVAEGFGLRIAFGVVTAGLVLFPILLQALPTQDRVRNSKVSESSRA